MKIRIGDRVKINKCKANQGFAQWYSKKIFIVTKIDGDVAELNSNLNEGFNNKININYLDLLKKERKKKLLRLKNL